MSGGQLYPETSRTLLDSKFPCVFSDESSCCAVIQCVCNRFIAQSGLGLYNTEAFYFYLFSPKISQRIIVPPQVRSFKLTP